MPVWHRETARWRESGALRLVGIVQEQHPDRARLFAQWHELGWPLLWDPFNVTRSEVVPSAWLVDEHGVVVAPVRAIDEAFAALVEAEPGPPPAAAERRELFRLSGGASAAGAPEDAGDPRAAALRALLARGPAEAEDAVATLARLAAERPDAPRLRFEAGVALRLRHDSAAARPGDLQAALDHWAAALALVPSQYVWRRRIQQVGPRLDKPYPFYSWVDEARAAIRARGEEPVALATALSAAERADGARAFEAAAEPDAPPDPGPGVPADDAGLVAVETAVAFDTSAEERDRDGGSAGPSAAVHLVLRPDPERDVHWTNDVEPLRAWVRELPAGWRASRRFLEHPRPAAATSAEVRRLDFELALPSPDASGTVVVRLVYPVCEGASGRCIFLRRDVTVAVEAP